MRIFRSADDIKAAVGEVLGTSEPLTIDQNRINQFADATSDHQWIHEGGVHMVVAHTVTIEVDGEQRPACVAAVVSRIYF